LPSPRDTDTPAEYYLAQFLVVALCAEMEERLEECAVSRAQEGDDSRLASYVASMARVSRRGLYKSDISKFVGLFGADAKDNFNDAIEDRKVSLYNNLVGARHTIAHGHGSNVTLEEVREVLEIADEILEQIYNALRLP